MKIRGVRVEPAEVEAALVAHPDVEQALVIARRSPASGNTASAYLAAYVVPAGSEPPRDLRGYMSAKLPDHLVPSAFVTLDRLPLLPNGKADRSALPEPEFAGVPHRAPRNATEKVLCRLFAEVLGVERVGIDDDFLVRGGHSLLATRLVNRIRAELGAEVRVGRVFDAPTVARLSGHLATGGPARPPLRRAETRPELVPLSFAQRRLWFVDRFEGPSATYNQSFVLRLTGPLDVDALRVALRDLVARHETLRTLVAEDPDGRPYQRVLPVADADLDVAPAEVAPDAVDEELARIIGRPFRLAADIPVRTALLRLGVEEHLLPLVIHHIAVDGESIAPSPATWPRRTRPAWSPARLTGPNCPSSTSTTRCGSANCSATRTTRTACWPPRRSSGARSWPGRRSHCSCRPTGHGPRRPVTAVTSSSSASPPRS